MNTIRKTQETVHEASRIQKIPVEDLKMEQRN